VDNINQGRGVNEVVAINGHEFLVLERDNRTNLAGSTPNLKRIYKIDLSKNGAEGRDRRVQRTVAAGAGGAERCRP
jgi:hypothetical protein